MASVVELSDGEHIAPRELLLDRALRELNPGTSWGVVRRAITRGKVMVDGEVVREPRHPVAAGAVLVVTMTAPRRVRFKLPEDTIVYFDSDVVVVRKPPGLVSVPDDNWPQGTLAQLVADRLPRRRRQVPLGVVQRLDVDTSGLMVFTRSPRGHRQLKEQLRERSVERRYLAVVAGAAVGTTYRSYLIEHSNGKRSSTLNRKIGKFACTHTELVEALTGASLVRCALETGRTHQIRIHLSEAGHPLLGDKRYARRRIIAPPAPRVMLHAAVLGFHHPASGALMRFEEAPPDDMRGVIERLKVP